MIAPSRQRPGARKKISGSAALAVLGDGWTTSRVPRSTLGPFDMDPVPEGGHVPPARVAAVAVELAKRAAR